MSNESNHDQDSQQLLADLLVLSELPVEKLRKIGDRLQQHDGFVSVEAVCGEAFSESSEREAVQRITSKLKPDAIDPLLAMVQQWRESDPAASELMTSGRLENITINLPALIRHSPAVERTRKAGALQTVTGNELMGVMFICDARPVFNETRDDIDGYVPLATMKMMYQEQNADVKEIEFVMTPDELDRLVARAEQAKEKIQVLNEKLSATIPNAHDGGQQ